MTTATTSKVTFNPVNSFR